MVEQRNVLISYLYTKLSDTKIVSLKFHAYSIIILIPFL